MPEHLLRWAQDPDPERGLPEAWELDYALDAAAWEPVLLESPARPCAACWEAVADVPRPAGWVRARALYADGESSEWTPPLRVPEPTGVEILGLAFLALLIVEGLRKR